LPNDLTNGFIMAFAAGSVKLVIANEFRVGCPRWPAPAAATGVGLVMRPHLSAVLFQSSAILLTQRLPAAIRGSVVGQHGNRIAAMSPRKLVRSYLSISFVSIVASVSAQQIEPQIVERTIDSATYQRVVLLTNGAGEVTTKTNLLTVLDHGLHYLQDGEFKESQDLVESFPDGAIARQGLSTPFSAPS